MGFEVIDLTGHPNPSRHQRRSAGLDHMTVHEQWLFGLAGYPDRSGGVGCRVILLRWVIVIRHGDRSPGYVVGHPDRSS